ncbi:hypothetical protein [Serratia fonticola]|uniref:hypothetical protein n=1 Tax=Serratia fonticola TaxID=47917 RepID=UPI0021AD9809|nr:hypothetical protein [Serratia fonticola]HBE9090503.1 hypothetical protein [Serratia fonticola]
MFRFLLSICLLLPAISIAAIKYEVTKAEIRPFISNSFGTGYMGLQTPPKEPGYGVFLNVRLSSNDDAEIMTFLSGDNSPVKVMVCKNEAMKSLLENLYTVSVSYYKQNGDLLISLLANKNSCREVSLRH